MKRRASLVAVEKERGNVVDVLHEMSARPTPLLSVFPVRRRNASLAGKWTDLVADAIKEDELDKEESTWTSLDMVK